MFSDFVGFIFFDVPAGIIILLLAIFGVWKKRPVVLIVAGVWSIPASEGLGLPIIVLPALFLFSAVYAVYKNRIRIAWLLLIPLFLYAVWMTVFSIYFGFFYLD